ncbi:hypothetical protein PV797_16495 [Clostridiaceae bacterium M8S5]|nr:hypothetical protein PV797_16495 [Clostridiaceae bacterium M8S5]
MTRKIGYWSTLMQSINGYLYLVVYIVFLTMFPAKPWNGVYDFVLQYKGMYKGLLVVIQILAFCQSFLYLIISLVINRYVSEKRKILANIGVCFAIIFLLLSSANYYIQWTSVRVGINKGALKGLEYLVQFNFDSPVSVLNILGWTFFFGISNIFIAFCFNNSIRGKWVARGFLLNGLSCIITFILFAIGIKQIMLLWTTVLVITWYVYPIMTISFIEEKKNIIS